MIHTPKKNNTARRLAFLTLLTGFILFAVCVFFDRQWIFQSLGLCAVVVGIQFVVRFVLSDYRYIIDNGYDGDICLIVLKNSRKSSIKLCHISLFKVREVCPRREKKIKADKVYNYCQNLDAEGVSVFYEDADKLCEIIIEADESFTEALKTRIGKGEGNITFAM